MSRGYIVIAQNNDTVDYLQQAYALALSLKATQNEVSNLSVCVEKGTKVPKKYRAVFDKVIDIPWNDEAKDATWKINNKWKFPYMTPYDETVVLDTDMVFPSDISYWWDIMSQKDIWATTNVKTFRGEPAKEHSRYREYFALNELPNIYSAFFYFKKSELTSEFFKLVELIMQNWEKFYFEFMPKGKPEFLSGDVAYALAIKLLGIEAETTMNHVDELPTFTHMKSYMQGLKDGSLLDDKWTESIPTYFSSIKDFKIGNFQQFYPFHYVDKDWLTEDIISSLENEIR